MIEVWKPIIQYDRRYLVSNTGRVRSFSSAMKGALMSPSLNSKGYLHVTITNKKKPICRRVHHLVIETFVGPRCKGMEVNHIDGNKLNNNLDNLEYITHTENMRHAVKIGLIRVPKGEANWKSVLTQAKAEKIRELYETTKTSWNKLAKLFGVSKKTIGRVIKGQTYVSMRT